MSFGTTPAEVVELGIDVRLIDVWAEAGIEGLEQKTIEVFAAALRVGYGRGYEDHASGVPWPDSSERS